MNRITPKPLTLVRPTSQEAPDATLDEALEFADVTKQLADKLAKRAPLDIDAIFSMKGED
jgi:hypothetical protein